MKDSDDLKRAFEGFDANKYCAQGTCESEDELKDYPSFTEALYAKIMAPSVSGVYISRWDIKDIAATAGDSMAIHPRKRMFELLMKYASDRDNMQRVLGALRAHIEDKIGIYEEFIRRAPTSSAIFESHIARAKKTIAFLPKILEEYF